MTGPHIASDSNSNIQADLTVFVISCSRKQLLHKHTDMHSAITNTWLFVFYRIFSPTDDFIFQGKYQIWHADHFFGKAREPL